MTKYALKTVLLSSILITLCIGQNVLAKEPTTVNLQYAAPCEAVIPQSDLLKSLQLDLQNKATESSNLINKFWENIKNKHSPIVEKIDEKTSRVIYLWRGAKHNVRLVGGPSNDHEWLTRLPNTDIWFKEVIVDNRFIGSYSFAVDLPNLDGYLSNVCPHLNSELTESRAQRRALLTVLQLDPYNPNKFLNEQEKNLQNLRNENILALSQAPQFIDPLAFPHRDLNLKTYHLNSKILGNDRKIQIYQSAKKQANQSYITAIFFDGPSYSQLLNVPKALDILVEQGKLPPIQAVFISPSSDENRSKELTPNPEFSAFFKTEFLAWLDQNIERDAQKTVLLGSSLGGLSSATLALENPQAISHVVPLSGSFWWQKQKEDVPNSASKLIREMPNQPKQSWYISANSYETSRVHNELSILQSSPIVAEDLRQKGHNVLYKEYIGGHSYAIWQVILQDALMHFFK